MACSVCRAVSFAAYAAFVAASVPSAPKSLSFLQKTEEHDQEVAERWAHKYDDRDLVLQRYEHRVFEKPHGMAPLRRYTNVFYALVDAHLILLLGCLWVALMGCRARPPHEFEEVPLLKGAATSEEAKDPRLRRSLSALPQTHWYGAVYREDVAGKQALQRRWAGQSMPALHRHRQSSEPGSSRKEPQFPRKKRRASFAATVETQSIAVGTETEPAAASEAGDQEALAAASALSKQLSMHLSTSRLSRCSSIASAMSTPQDLDIIDELHELRRELNQLSLMESPRTRKARSAEAVAQAQA